MQTKKLADIFNISYGNSFELNRLEIADNNSVSGVNFVSRTSQNNGISAKVNRLIDTEPFQDGLITVAVSGSVLETFLQPEKFYTGYHIMVLSPKSDMTEIEKLFYCYCIRLNKYRYSYGRQANRTLKDIQVPLFPDKWKSEIKTTDYLEIKQSISDKTIEIKPISWKSFRYDEIFTIKKGQRVVNNDLKSGETPCIRPIESNNGVYDYIDLPPNHEANTITVNYNGSVAEAFYQPRPYFALDDVNVLYPKFELNSYIAMFLITLIRKEKYRFNYGRKWNLGRMVESSIKLPVDKNNKPDWKYMENFIKSLSFSASISN